MIIVRELTGGLYYGTAARHRRRSRGATRCRIRAPEIERVARKAFQLARKRRKKVTSVDKSNVIENSQLWRKSRDRGCSASIRTSSSITCWWTTPPCKWC